MRNALNSDDSLISPHTRRPTSVALSNTTSGGTPPMCSKVSFMPWHTHTALSSPNSWARPWLDWGNDSAR